MNVNSIRSSLLALLTQVHVQPGRIEAQTTQRRLRSGGGMKRDVPPQTAGDEALSGPPEPWERWETSLVLGSLAVGLVGLVLLGWLVTWFILP